LTVVCGWYSILAYNSFHCIVIVTDLCVINIEFYELLSGEQMQKNDIINQGYR